MSRCTPYLPLLGPFADGELSPERMLEVEQHIAECPTCLERLRFDAALSSSIRQVAYDAAPVSPAFAERVRAALNAERARETAHATQVGGDVMLPSITTWHGMLPWRGIVPVAAAAAATLVWAASVNDSLHPRGDRYESPRSVEASLTDGVEGLIDEFVRYHAAPTADAVVAAEPELDRLGARASLEPAEEDLVQRFQPELGAPVRAPSLRAYGARWEGGAVVPLHNHHRRAALLRYRIGNQRVSVYLYDSKEYPLRARLEPRVVRDLPVYVGNRRGYSIAAAERGNVGIAATADLDDSETAELVAAAYP